MGQSASAWRGGPGVAGRRGIEEAGSRRAARDAARNGVAGKNKDLRTSCHNTYVLYSRTNAEKIKKPSLRQIKHGGGRRGGRGAGKEGAVEGSPLSHLLRYLLLRERRKERRPPLFPLDKS